MSTVLVIDDDPLIAKLITHKLTRLGFDVHSASDGRAGIEAARRIRPDLMLVDWMMPEMTGLEFCRAIRSSDLASTPIILLTARAQVTDMTDGMDAGATAYITKPFSPRELAQQVTALLATDARPADAT